MLSILLAVLITIGIFNISVGVAILVAVRKIESDGRLTRSDVIAIRRYTIPPDVGGRPIPTLAEIAAARNRIDPAGTAHPGGP